MSKLTKLLRSTGLNKPLKLPERNIRGIGRLVRGDFRGAWNDMKGGAAIAAAVMGAPYLASGLSKVGLGGVASGIGKLGSSGVGNAIKSVGKYALGNPDLILGGLSAVEGYKKGKNADRMLDRALNDPGLNPGAVDLSSTFGGYSNPYSAQPNEYGTGYREGALQPVLPRYVTDVTEPPRRSGGGGIKPVGRARIV